MEIRNGIIRSTFLGVEDHGIFTYMLNIEGDGWGQGFGGRRCDGTTFLGSSIRSILETIGAESWEKLPGTVVRIESDYDKIYRIGHVVKDRWFDIAKCAEESRNVDLAESPEAG